MPLPRRFLLPLVLLAATIVLVGLINVALPQATQAAAFVVTKTEDTNDGECSADDCSLREAIIAANAEPGFDTITLQPGTYVLTLGGAGEEAAMTGDLDLTDDVWIFATGTRQTIIDGDGADRVFEVEAGVTATLGGLWIRNGSALNGAGIRNAGTLTLERVLVRENAAGSSSTANGGGIQNTGTLSLRGSEVDSTRRPAAAAA